MSNRPDFAALCEMTGRSWRDLVDIPDYPQPTLERLGKGELCPNKGAVTILQNLIRQRRRERRRNLRTPDVAFRLVDLFAGIGGFRKRFDAIGGTCVFVSEWDRHARRTNRANFHDDDNHIMKGDIAEVDESSIPEHDPLLAGFPCQSFSLAGVSKKNAIGQEHGFRCRKRGNLFFDIVRIIDYHKPRIFVLENVKNLVNHDQGKTFEIISHCLEDVPDYQISTRIIDAKGFVPRHRERIFTVGFRDRTNFDLKNIKLPDPTDGPKLGTILHAGDGPEPGPDQTYTDSRGQVLPKYTPTDHLWEYLQNYAERRRRRGNGFGCTVNGPDVAHNPSQMAAGNGALYWRAEVELDSPGWYRTCVPECAVKGRWCHGPDTDTGRLTGWLAGERPVPEMRGRA